MLCFVTGIYTKELPRISQAIQLKAGRIVPYFKVMRAWCDRFLVKGYGYGIVSEFSWQDFFFLSETQNDDVS